MISIIVPVYNVEKYLAECIESLVAQDYRELEILLVDNGSTDNSGLICDDYAKKDSRITVIHLPENRGISAARNAGLDANPKGEYFVFIDSDDYIAPNYVSRLLSSMQEHPEADLVLCRFYNCYEQPDGTYVPTPCKSQAVKEVLTREEVLLERLNNPNVYYVVVWNKLYKRKLFETMRYPDGFLCEDVWITRDLFSQCNYVVCINDPLYYYRNRSNSASHNTSIEMLNAQLDWMCSEVLYYAENDSSNLKYPAKQFISMAYKNRKRLSKDDRARNKAAWNLAIKSRLTSGSLKDRLKYLFYFLTYPI